jgi:hypothetical protein
MSSIGLTVAAREHPAAVLTLNANNGRLIAVRENVRFPELLGANGDARPTRAFAGSEIRFVKTKFSLARSRWVRRTLSRVETSIPPCIPYSLSI